MKSTNRFGLPDSLIDSAQKILSENKKPDNLNELIKILRKKALSLGVNLTKFPTDGSKKMGEFNKPSHIPKLPGFFDGLFKTIEVKAAAGFDVENEFILLLVRYEWTHPDGGSNGHAQRYEYEKGKWNL
jgi:hypothetical protein